VSHQQLTTFPHDPLLDLEPWVGQRQCTYRFERINGVTGEVLGEIHPLRGATLTHDTTRTIKRQLSFNLGVVDSALVEALTDRILVFMVFPNGAEYPLGRYIFTDQSQELFTSGRLANMVLNDEMFLVDQQITTGVGSSNRNVVTVVQEVLEPLPVSFDMEPSPFASNSSWSIGTGRGALLEDLATQGDYFSPWFDNEGVMRWIRSFDPADGRLPDFDFDAHRNVLRAGITETSDLLTAPNKFIVISNAPNNTSTEVVGIADIPSNAPHSFASRGFEIASVQDLQVLDAGQAQAVARNLANRQTVFERTTLSTPPDPRHDSYNVIRWQGALWLELAWSMALVEGGAMGHLLRKAYSP
jgi:hypothetical protein